MKPGDRVEVHAVLLANPWPLPPTKVWRPGYRLVRLEGENAIVQLEPPATFAGVHIRFAMSEIRAAAKSA